MLRVTIDGKAHEFPIGLTILKALSQIHADVPHLCHDDRLKPYGGCRLCVVEVDGKPHPISACDNPLVDGMVIHTKSDRLHALRKTNLTLLAARYPAEAVNAEPWRPFHRYLREYGVEAQGLAPKDDWKDESHPYIDVDMSRCIYCYRCVRICEEVQGQFVWQAYQRGDETHIRPQTGESLLTSECVSCGACVDSCPSGALADKSVRRHGEAERWTETTCVYCGTGCQMNVGEKDGKIVEIRPVLDAAVNRGHLCAKGRYAFEFASAPDRITRPMIRENGEWREVDWDRALTFTAERLMEIARDHGPEAIGVLGSARATNEENYLAQKFARAVLGVNNVDCCARVCHQPSAVALKRMLGTGAATNSFDDIEQAATIMLCGCNPTENHPIVGARIKQAVLAGAKLIVVDPRRIELVRCADLYLPVKPGHNVQLFNAIACAILEAGLEDGAFIAERVSDCDAYREFIMQYRPEAVAVDCGVSAELIREAARLYASGKPSMCFHGLGLTEHIQGSEGVMTLINLALLTGNLGKPGTGVNPLRGQNNVQGSAQMGCEPTTLTGAQPLDEARALFESVWGCDIPTARGLTLLDMVDEAAVGELKAVWTIGYDFYLTLSDLNRTKEALSNLDLVIVQDLFLNETAKAFGTVFLPAASVFEKDGTFMNSDRRVQRVRKVIEPVGDSWPDWWIICALAERLGKGSLFAYDDAEAIWNEVRRVWPKGAGLSYARLENESLHWPCPGEDHPGTPVLHADSFAAAKQAALRRIDFRPTAEQRDDEFPWILNTGRTLYHFNAGTMTYRTDNAVLQHTDFLDIAPADAERLRLEGGERVKVRSRHGEVILPIRISGRVREGELFATFHDPSLFVNRLTSPYRDNLAKTPEYKVTAVTIARVD